MISPTQRAKADCKKRGWLCAITERWNPFAHVRQDLLGFCDMLVIDPSLGIIAVQVSSGAHHAERQSKIEAEPRAVTWMLSGGRVEVWTYRKGGAVGKRKVYEQRRTRAFLDGGKIGGWVDVGV